MEESIDEIDNRNYVHGIVQMKGTMKWRIKPT